ncbi:hypothetical protein [Listeria booriae]|uniref:hypothetical protein n=1 Tax=Listeria booriae TaxID=1552123 RepID=UPI0016241CC2|nr:hypothetical protein [Listeria booriae]MBC2164674.1 hypothetical protein [Listeria booriae]
MDLMQILAADIPLDEKIQQIDAYYLENLISKKRASEILEIHPNTIDLYVREKKLVPFISEHRNVLFKKQDILDFKPEVMANKKKFKK